MNKQFFKNKSNNKENELKNCLVIACWNLLNWICVGNKYFLEPVYCEWAQDVYGSCLLECTACFFLNFVCIGAHGVFTVQNIYPNFFTDSTKKTPYFKCGVSFISQKVWIFVVILLILPLYVRKYYKYMCKYYVDILNEWSPK